MERPNSTSQRRACMQLPLEERRRILAEQAEEMAAHYEEEGQWRELGGGHAADY